MTACDKFAAGFVDLAANISDLVVTCGNPDAGDEKAIVGSNMQQSLYLFVIVVLAAVCHLVATYRSSESGGKEPVEKDLWHISGADYDLSAFVKQHPGGPIAIGLGRGIDCTQLFVTYHAAGSPARAILEKYRVSSKTAELQESEFHKALCQTVKDHFAGQGKWAHKASYSHLVLLAAIMLAMIASWWAWFAGYWFSLLTLPISSWLVFANGVHDASHFAVTSVAWVNHAMTFPALPLFSNPITWYSQHVVKHHCHCNEVDEDVDLYHLMPIRLHKHVDSIGGMGHLAKAVLTGIHLGIGVPLNCLTGVLENLPDGFIHGNRIKLLRVFSENPLHYLSVWMGVLGAFGFSVTSFFVHDTVFKKVCFTAVPYVIASLLFIVFTQVSHIQEACQADRTLQTDDFFKRQALSSLDYSVDSKLWSILSGGVNMQSLHHCLPWVNSCHYTALYPKFREICRQHEAVPPQVENFPEALSMAYKYIVKMNCP
ncbi:unnamed protein product [Effrenium voratum]|uniref:Cytochrome b5 heme-binding domain-containing protein n=1 Tax=Effrenium voratum TaxID=2562239 RepID=A0AA36J8X1_9DINO|nr:unnamed protein product [Effrenium voratum]CAJ1426706.1 unnamed protein product [Effrenium voratum]